MESKHKNILIGGLIAIVAIMAIGYAAFATQLNVNGTANVTSSWDVHIKDITPGTAEAGTLTGTAKNVSVSVDESGLTATFQAQLESPGDSITYDVVIENSGSLPAKVSDIVFNQGSTNAITYSMSGIAEDDVLAPNATQTAKVTVSYNSGVTTQPAEDDKTSSLSMTVSYVQNRQ